MPSFGQRESAEAIRARVGPDARYSTYGGVRTAEDAKLPSRAWGRILWGASLFLFVVVLIVAALVALGL
jgi:hypothetical protein